jgi:hypothetical protein
MLPLIVLLVSLGALIATLEGGAGPLDLGPLLSALGILAALLLAALDLRRAARARDIAAPRRRRAETVPVQPRYRLPADRRGMILVDGSNVMRWREGTPDLSILVGVLRLLDAEGLVPVVVFDANAGYLVGDGWMGPAVLAERLGLSRDRVIVADKGTQADPILLQIASETGAAIVTKDRFRDWAEDWPLVREPGRLRRGGWRNGALTLAPGASSREVHVAGTAG